MYKTLTECKKCEMFKGVDGSFIKCHNNDITSYVPCMPAQYIDGFKNGTKVVKCSKNRPMLNKRVNARNADGKFTVDI